MQAQTRSQTQTCDFFAALSFTLACSALEGAGVGVAMAQAGE